MKRPVAILMAVGVGGGAGSFFGLAVACAEMLGAAEIFPPGNLPEAPDPIAYMLVGAFLGAVAGALTACVILIAMVVIRSGKRRILDEGRFDSEP